MATRPANRTYKRTWKNLLINKRYQLRFTLFMVGLSAILMGLLGWWVMTVAARATTLAVNNTLSACQDLPGSTPATAVEPEPAAPPAPAPGEPAGGEGTAGEGAAGEGRPRPRPVVTIDDSGMKDVPPAPDSTAPAPVATPAAPPEAEAGSYERCVAALPGKVKGLEARERLIFWVLVGAGVLITLGLLAYGIKMTHRVAGPLYKVTLYMAKLRGGVYDVVYNLRKGDQLVGFYEHFKSAHAGMRTMQEEDVARLRQVLAAADQGGLAARSPAVAAAAEELRAVLDGKEKSLV
ncbi:MAG TPA: hypothetical protein VK698_31010 [Kofleriaceae bacterium]|nr:hypothetical protein [Kofleriaceae bacterium]